MGILSSPRFDIPLATYLPSKLVATQLWKIYVDTVDPCFKILHIPTDEIIVFTAIDDPINASSDAMALCFAVYYAATVARDVNTAQEVVREEILPSLQQFKTGLELAFAHADFLENPTLLLLQALGIYVVSFAVPGESVILLLGRGVTK